MAGKAMRQISGGGNGQSFNDRMQSAKHIITGSGLNRAACKATTEEMIAPKKKHLSYLIECTNQGNVSIPELANALLGRLNSHNWIVVFKALISVHSMMNYGNERFTQYLASNNCNLALRNFYDKSSVQGADMSRFICRYSAYVQEKAFSYRSLAFDLCKVKRGSEDALVRTLSVERLLRALPVLIAQFDALLSFDATPTELNNAIIHAAFVLLYKDASRLFVVFNDGIINMLSTYFESMNRKQCKEAVDLYKKFLVRSERLAEFSRVAEAAGVDRADTARLERHPTSFLEAMESHLGQLDGRRVSRSDSNASISSVGAVAATPTPASVATPAAATPAAAATASGGISEAQRQALLMDEQRQLDRLKAERQKQLQQGGTQAQAAANGKASLPPPQQQPQQPQPQQAAKSDEDNLLLLDPVPAASAKLFTPFMPPQQLFASQPVALTPFQNSGFPAFPPTSAYPTSAAFSASTAFPTSAAYPAVSYSNAAAPSPAPMSAAAMYDPFGSVLEPIRPQQQLQQQPQQQQQPRPQTQGLTADLDSSLATLATRLDKRETTGAPQGRFSSSNWPAQTGQSGAGGSAPRTAPVPIAPGPTVNWGVAAARPAVFTSAMPLQLYSGPHFVYGQPYAAAVPIQQQQLWQVQGSNPFLNPAAQQPNSGGGAPDPFGAL